MRGKTQEVRGERAIVKLTKGERGRARTGGEVERKGTHTAGQSSGWDRTWADEGSGRDRTGGEVERKGTHTAG